MNAARTVIEAGSSPRPSPRPPTKSSDIRPTPARRGFLCELLCFAGDFERADKHLDAWQPGSRRRAAAISLFRQLLRAEQARQQFYAEGRLPEFLDSRPPRSEAAPGGVDPHPRRAAGRGGRSCSTQAEEQRPALAGDVRRPAVRRLPRHRRPDGLVLRGAHAARASTTGFRWSGSRLIEFRQPERPRDLLWRRAHMVVRGGPDGEVFLPALYAGSHAEADDRAPARPHDRLARRRGRAGPRRRASGCSSSARRIVSILEFEADHASPPRRRSNGPMAKIRSRSTAGPVGARSPAGRRPDGDARSRRSRAAKCCAS